MRSVLPDRENHLTIFCVVKAGLPNGCLGVCGFDASGVSNPKVHGPYLALLKISWGPFLMRTFLANNKYHPFRNWVNVVINIESFKATSYMSRSFLNAYNVFQERSLQYYITVVQISMLSIKAGLPCCYIVLLFNRRYLCVGAKFHSVSVFFHGSYR